MFVEPLSGPTEVQALINSCPNLTHDSDLELVAKCSPRSFDDDLNLLPQILELLQGVSSHASLRLAVVVTTIHAVSQRTLELNAPDHDFEQQWLRLPFAVQIFLQFSNAFDDGNDPWEYRELRAHGQQVYRGRFPVLWKAGGLRFAKVRSK